MRSLLRPGGRSRRREIILNLDSDPDNGLWSAAVRRGDYKLLWGQSRQDLRDERNLVSSKASNVQKIDILVRQLTNLSWLRG